MAEERSIQVGDVVWLKSGSEAMTVERVSDDNALCVFWHKSLGRAESCSARIHALTTERTRGELDHG